MSSKKKFFLFTLLVFLTIITRFWNLNWSSNFSFHPDENNMVSAILRLNSNNFNPGFFAYGQFPLYLSFFTAVKHEALNVRLTLRFWSAVYSSLTVFLFYLIGQKILESKKIAFIFALLTIFTPGLIQSAHFGTTESILIFVFTLNIYLSFLIFKHPEKKKLLLLSGLISGIGIATKISALIFLVPFCFSFLFLFIRPSPKKTSKKNLNLILKFSFLILTTALFSIIFSPFNLIGFPDFISAMKYEIGVATGAIPVFYTRQFMNTLPYLFQFQKIFPYTEGLFIFIFSFLGLGFIVKKSLQKHQTNPYLLITLFSGLIYFLYQGQLFTKWTRFMSPIFFIAPLLSLFFIKEIANKFLQKLFILLAILPGIYFFINTYLFPDVRIQATQWINQNIPKNSTVLSETGNVVNLPLYDSKINVNHFDFYALDADQSDRKLKDLINKSDYIFIPSRRVFKSQNNSSFPLSQNYYQQLFSGQLEFFQIKTFSKSNSLLLNPENAEETWSIFDNPVIRIYQKQ